MEIVARSFQDGTPGRHRKLELLLNHAPKFDITIFGGESHVNYNRILLSSVLAGENSIDELTLNDLKWYQTNRIGLQLAYGFSRSSLTDGVQVLFSPHIDLPFDNWRRGHN